MKAQIYLFITIALAILLLSCGLRFVDPNTSSAEATAGDGLSTAALQSIIESGNLAGLSTNTDFLVTNTFTYLTANANYSASTTLEVIYATENGSGDYSGTNWTNAIAATNLRKTINDISDASATNVYAVLVAGGTYKPDYSTTAQRGVSFAMKNHVAIIGGFTASNGTGSWERTGTTTFSGDIGTEGSIGDNSYHVFSHTSITLNNGLLYGVTITGGNANASSVPQNLGGGMYNRSSSPRLVDVRFVSSSANNGGGMYNVSSSSPRLVRVEFTSNSAKVVGGGMHNSTSSSPVLTRVEFTGNSAGFGGGGMYNVTGSSPVLRGVVFRNNKSTGVSGFIGSGRFITRGGGGMFNENSSSPVLWGVVFVGNSATGGEGGGMYNTTSSSPILVGAVFRGNSAKNNGGGMYSISSSRPLIVNSIFAGNTASNSASGHDIAMNGDIRIAGSVLGIGLTDPINGVVLASRGGSRNVTHHSLTKDAVNFGGDRTTDAATGGLTYPTIQGGSSAINVGLYVQRSGGTYYFSESGTGTTWHTSFTATGGLAGTAGDLPANTEDITATDIAGNARNGRPDAGVSEYK